MAVKNYWSFEPGETIVAEKLMTYCKDYDFYFPLKDTGIDILGAHKTKNKTLKFQVKESRYYEKPTHSWHQESLKNIEENKGRVDFYVFVTYIPSYLYEEQTKPSFKTEFIIIPMKDLLKLIKLKEPNKAGKYNFYFDFHREEGKIIEIREKNKVWLNNKNFDYKKYHNNWELIK